MILLNKYFTSCAELKNFLNMPHQGRQTKECVIKKYQIMGGDIFIRSPRALGDLKISMLRADGRRYLVLSFVFLLIMI